MVPPKDLKEGWREEENEMSEHIPSAPAGIGRFGSDVVSQKFSDEEGEMASSVSLAHCRHSQPEESSLKRF